MMGKVRWKRTDGEEEEEGGENKSEKSGGFTNTWISLKNYIPLVLYGMATKMSLSKFDWLFMFNMPRKNSVE